MKISYKWLQTYFKEPLPAPEIISDLLTMHLAEVESLERMEDDIIFDVKVLPDRAPYLLNHQGLAKELSALISNNFIARETALIPVSENINKINVEIKDPELCDRYIFGRVLDISKHESPEWLSKRLHAIGQRSINLIVDLANFVMLDIGQPMHAFDAEKLDGDIEVRSAREGETITTLDNKEIKLDPSILVIADKEGPVAIAGVKGGKRAEVTNFTKHIILESAHFNASMVRKTSGKIGIKNESSKRYENNVSPSYALSAMNIFLNLLYKEDSGISVGEIKDINFSSKEEKYLSVPFDFIKNYLGGEFSSEFILEALNKANIFSEMKGNEVLIKVPEDRPDISIKEDVADEVGRIVGYENIKGVLPKVISKREPNKEISWKNFIISFLLGKGYSEIYTYTLKNEGEVEIANPLASDKSFLRKNLSDSMEEKLAFNLHYADLLGTQNIRLFEIGKVFSKDACLSSPDGLANGRQEERTSLCIGVAYKKPTKDMRPNDEIKNIRDELFEKLGANLNTVCTIDDTGGLIIANNKQIGTINNKDGIMEIDLDSIFPLLSEIDSEAVLEKSDIQVKFKSISTYPFASRDIAVFVPGEQGKENEVSEIIKKHAGDFLVRVDLFDVFTKNNKEVGEQVGNPSQLRQEESSDMIFGVQKSKTSYAFRLVFQSQTETLSEDQLNKIMKNITDAMNSKEGWEVR